MASGPASSEAGVMNGINYHIQPEHAVNDGGMYAVARPSSAMSGIHGGLASFHGSSGIGGGSSSSGGSSMMGSPFQHADSQHQLQQLQNQNQHQFQFYEPNVSQAHGLLASSMFDGSSSQVPHVHQLDQYMPQSVQNSAISSSEPGVQISQANRNGNPLLSSQQSFGYAQHQQHLPQQHHDSNFQNQHPQAHHAQFHAGERMQNSTTQDPRSATAFMNFAVPPGLEENLTSSHAQMFGSSSHPMADRRELSSPHSHQQIQAWNNHSQPPEGFVDGQAGSQLPQVDYNKLGASFGLYGEENKHNMDVQRPPLHWHSHNDNVNLPANVQEAQSRQRGSMSMQAQSVGTLPTNAPGLQQFMPKQAEGEHTFDFTDHNLSNALANNAQISSSKSSDVIRRHGLQGTPTILEEDEQAFLRHQNAVFAPQGQQQHHLQAFNVNHNEFGNAGAAPLPLHLQMQPVGHNIPPLQADLDVASVSAARRNRPNLRPTTYQQYTNINMNALEEQQLRDTEDCLPYIDDIIFNYLSTPSRLGLGERTVMVMTSKVAQKSYGAEKRFLCPPPMVLLVGSSWWSACKQSVSASMDPQGNNGIGAIEDSAPTILTPPRLSINMSGEGAAPPQDGVLEWATSNGKLIDTDNPSSEFAISGRSIGRQLFINDSDEKRRHCEALVHLTVPAAVASDRRPLGVFASKPIKVISKPSKKRQSTRNSELGVNHGSTISLFHRLRSQTVSTRYLCVSGAPTWFKGSDGNPFLNTDSNTHIPNQGDPPSCFVAKTSSWDPFIVYLVNPHMNAKDSNTATQQAQAANQEVSADGRPAHYPAPPINSLPFAHGSISIHYNQPVVLQCLNTAVVSPVMVSRKADRGTAVVGSGDPFAPFGPNGPPSGDTYGEPVSQLHKIAFEVLEEGSTVYGEGGPGSSGHFLGCLNEDVGLRKPISERQWIFNGGMGNMSMAIGGGNNTQSRPSTPTTPITPMVGQMSVSSSSMNSLGGGTVMGPPFESFKTEGLMSPNSAHSYSNVHSRMMSGSSTATQGMYHPNSGMTSSRSSFSADTSADGGKVKRPRRVSSSSLVQQKERGSGSSKGRKRGQSLSVVGLQNQMQIPNDPSTSTGSGSRMTTSSSLSAMNYAQQQGGPGGKSGTNGVPSSSSDALLRRTSSFANSLTNSEASSFSMAAGLGNHSAWTVEVHDSDVWTIVGVDIARHTFYLPPTLIGGAKAKADGVDASIAHLVTVPAPQRPITPMPIVLKYSGGTLSKALAGKDTKSATDDSVSRNKVQDHVILTGTNLTPDLFIYFGDWRSTHVSVINPNTIYCAPPPPLDDVGLPRDLVPIILVRRDGVIFPTDCIYQP